MDKRDLSGVFRERLRRLLERSGLNHSAFAASIGIDRSALSQLLSSGAVRLPRAETLLAIARAHEVSLDWLLGQSQDEGVTGELRPTLASLLDFMSANVESRPVQEPQEDVKDESTSSWVS